MKKEAFKNASSELPKAKKYPNVTPLWGWVYVVKLEDKEKTLAGIFLPEKSKIPTYRARILKVGPWVEHMQPPEESDEFSLESEGGSLHGESPFQRGDEVIIHYRSDKQCVEIDGDENLLLVPAQCCIAKVEL